MVTRRLGRSATCPVRSRAAILSVAWAALTVRIGRLQSGHPATKILLAAAHRCARCCDRALRMILIEMGMRAAVKRSLRPSKVLELASVNDLICGVRALLATHVGRRLPVFSALPGGDFFACVW